MITKEIITEIGRVLISLLTLVIGGFLYWLGFNSTDIAFKLAATNLATAIVTGNIAYWLKPG